MENNTNDKRIECCEQCYINPEHMFPMVVYKCDDCPCHSSQDKEEISECHGAIKKVICSSCEKPFIPTPVATEDWIDEMVLAEIGDHKCEGWNDNDELDIDTGYVRIKSLKLKEWIESHKKIWEKKEYEEGLAEGFYRGQLLGEKKASQDTLQSLIEIIEEENSELDFGGGITTSGLINKKRLIDKLKELK